MSLSDRRRQTAQPIAIVDVELTEPAPSLVDEGPVRLLVRQSGRPLGLVPAWVPPGGLSSAVVEATVRHNVDPTAIEQTVQPTPPTAPSISVVVTACGATAELVETLRGIQRQTLSAHEIIVVDNRPAVSGIADLLAGERLSDIILIEEARPGLSRARNAGLRKARGEIVAFTDDDVVVDTGWLAALGNTFTDPTVMCVTGLVLPLELQTPAQCWVEEFGGFSKGFRRCRFNLTDHRGSDALYPYAVGVFGTGANAAFRTEALRRMGGFDEQLGAGTPTRGGEDLDIYLSVVQSGATLVYEPAALVRHHHHRDVKRLRRQIFGYGVGLSAMLTKRWISRPQERREMARRAGAALRYLVDPNSPKNIRKSRSYGVGLTIAELLGVLYGPFAYWLSRVVRGGAPRLPQPCSSHDLSRPRGEPPTMAAKRPGSTHSDAPGPLAKPHKVTTREGLLLMANTGGTALLGVAYWGIAARGLPVAVVGSGNALIAAVSTISNLSQLNLYTSLGVILPRARAAGSKLVAKIYRITVCLTVAITTLAFLTMPAILGRSKPPSLTDGAAVVIGAAMWTIFVLEDGALIAVRSARVVLISNVGYGAVKIIALLALLRWAPTLAVPVSWYSPLFVIVPVVNWRLFARLRGCDGGHHHDQLGSQEIAGPPNVLSRFVVVDYVGFLLLQVATTALPVFVSTTIGSASAAIFAACWMVSSTVDLLATNAAMSMTVGIARDPESARRVLRTVMPRLLGGVAAIVLVMLAIAPWILHYFGATYVETGRTVLRLLLVSSIFRVVVTICCATARSLMRPGLVVALQASVAVVVLGGGLPTMTIAGLPALAAAWMCAQITAAAAAIAMIGRQLR